MRKAVLFLLTLSCGMLSAQAPDTLQKTVDPVDFLYQWLFEATEGLADEELSSDDLTEDGYEELIERYLFYQDNPININGEATSCLEEMGLLSAFQLHALSEYRRQFGDLLFLEELLMVDGFDETVVAVISPLVHLGKSERTMEQERLSVGKAVTQGRHQVTLNYARKFGGTTNEDYMGSPDKLQLKYAYHYKQKWRFGFAMEKDAGEPFFLNGLGDSLQEVVSQYRQPGFDFYGMYLYLTDIRLTKDVGKRNPVGGWMLENLALGDYQLGFGQGLTLWSGMSFGKGMGGSSVMKRATGVKPKTSAGEGKFFRGAATTLRYRNFHATVFCSRRSVDATVSLTDSIDEPTLVSALQESGYHRTLNEMAKRNAIRQQVLGGHLCYAGPRLEIGCTISHLRLNVPLELKSLKYNRFYFQGDRLTNMGVDFRWLVGKTVFFGELSRSDNGAYAGVVGMTMKPTGYINFSVLFRNYNKRYQNLFNGAFGESSRRQGEEGVYLGLQCSPQIGWDLIGYVDFFRLTWLGSQVYTPSWGQEWSLKATHRINQRASMQLQFKAKTKMKNTADDAVFSHYPIFYTKRTVRFQVSYDITDALSFSDKVSYSHYLNDDGADSRGYLVCHDIAYRPAGRPYSLTFRYALFDSDDYYSRVSIYENDVLGAFSIPSLSGAGCRVYLLGKLKVFGNVSLYSRIGCSVISEDTKIDFKAEIIGKF